VRLRYVDQARVLGQRRDVEAIVVHRDGDDPRAVRLEEKARPVIGRVLDRDPRTRFEQDARFGLWDDRLRPFQGFVGDTGEVLSFVPSAAIPFCAVAATIAETILGLLLVAKKSRFATVREVSACSAKLR